MKICTNIKIMTTAQYAYDALGRRIGKYDAAAMETTFYYYYDQWQILAEYTADTTCRQWFMYGNYIDEVLSRNTHATGMTLTIRYYAHDHLYSPVALVSFNGAAVQERYEYDAYGKVTITGRGADNLWYTADDVTLSASAYNNPFTFTGRQLDILDNGTLHHMHYRHRDYSQQLGRFMQHDPYGINPAEDFPFYSQLQYINGANIYQYSKSNSMRRTDPLGLSPHNIGGWFPQPGRDFMPVPSHPTNPGSNPGNSECCTQKDKSLYERFIYDKDDPQSKVYEKYEQHYAEKFGLGGLDGYYRHCTATCNTNRILSPGLRLVALPISFACALTIGGDWSPGENLNSNWDIMADYDGLKNSYKLFLSCEDACASSFWGRMDDLENGFPGGVW